MNSRITNWLPVVALVCLVAATTGQDGVNQEGFRPYSKHHDLSPGALASVGGGAPDYGCCGTLCGPGLNNVNEILTIGAVEIANEWDGASDMVLHLHAVPTDSDPVATTEDIDLDFQWRSVAPGTETGKTGTVASDTVTYLQSGAGAECDVIIFALTVPYTGGNQPLVVEDDLGLFFNRNPGTEANSYTGNIIIYKAELIYSSIRLPTH